MRFERVEDKQKLKNSRRLSTFQFFSTRFAVVFLCGKVLRGIINRSELFRIFICFVVSTIKLDFYLHCLLINVEKSIRLAIYLTSTTIIHC